MRVAVILDADAPTAVHDFEEASHYFFHLWGGQYSAIIPSSDGAIDAPWYRLLEILDPDCVYAVPVLRDEIVGRINRELAPAVVRHGLGKGKRHGGRLSVFSLMQEHPAGITTLPRTIAALRSTLFTPHLVHITGTGGDDPFKQFLAQNFGTLSMTVDLKDAFHDAASGSYNLDTDDPHTVFAALAKGGNDVFTPDRVSSYYANPPARGRSGKYEHRFTIVVGDSVHERALARAIRMFETQQDGRRSIWLPTALCADADAITLLRQLIIKCYWSGGNTKYCQVVSLSAEPGALSNLAKTLSAEWQVHATVEDLDRDSLGLPEPDDFFTPAGTRTNWGWPFSVNLTKGRECTLADQAGVLDLQLPEFVSALPAQDQIMVDLEIPFFRNDESSFTRVISPAKPWRLPRRQGLAAAFLPSSTLTRITRAGIPAAALTAGADRLPIHVPSPFTLFYHWTTNDYISEHDVVARRNRRFARWEISDPGRFLETLIRLFGSPYACSHMLAEPFWGPALRRIALGANASSHVTVESVRRALCLLVEHEGPVDLAEPDELDRAASFLSKHIHASANQQTGIPRKRLQRMFGEMKNEAPKGHWYWTKADWKEYDLNRELNSHVEWGILRMGVHVRCHACLTTQWLPANDIADTVTCAGCGTHVALGAEPEWCYQVNALAAEAIRRRDVIAIVQALYAAERDSRGGTFVVLPSLNCFEAEAKAPFTDIDLLYFAERELVIGEVKANPSGFSQTDLDKLSDVAADLLPNRVVLAAPGQEWPSKIEERVEHLSKEQGDIGVAWEIRKLRW